MKTEAGGLSALCGIPASGVGRVREDGMAGKRISRRSFLKKAPGAAAGLLTLGSLPQLAFSAPTAYGPRQALPNPYVTPDLKPILVCVEGSDYRLMLKKGLDILGGLSKLIDDNQDVLIKPNCNFSNPYPGVSGVRGIRALACETVKVTDGTVTVADEGFQPAADVYEYLDLEYPVTSAGASLELLSATYDVRADHWMGVPDHKVYQKVYDAPIIINTCNLKRHDWAAMTCALKNNVGTISGANASATRAYLHSFTGADFQRAVAEIAGLVNPELNVVDARAVLTVNGPFTRDGLVRNANKVIICGDMVATDAYCAQLLAEHDDTFDASMITPLLEHGVQIGLGTATLEDVEIIETTES